MQPMNVFWPLFPVRTASAPAYRGMLYVAEKRGAITCWVICLRGATVAPDAGRSDMVSWRTKSCRWSRPSLCKCSDVSNFLCADSSTTAAARMGSQQVRMEGWMKATQNFASLVSANRRKSRLNCCLRNRCPPPEHPPQPSGLLPSFSHVPIARSDDITQVTPESLEVLNGIMTTKKIRSYAATSSRLLHVSIRRRCSGKV